MEEKIQFSENVIVMDVDFLNGVVESIRKPAGEGTRPELPYLEWGEWLSCLALDGGLKPAASNEVQVLLVHAHAVREVSCCRPSSLEALQGKACRTPVAEFLFSAVPTAGMISSEALFLDLMRLALDAAGVKRLMLLPFHAQYGAEAVEELTALFQERPVLAGKVTYFEAEPGRVVLPCRVDSVFYSLAKAFGL